VDSVKTYLGDLYPRRIPDASRPEYFRITWTIRTTIPLPPSAAVDVEESIEEVRKELRDQYNAERSNDSRLVGTPDATAIERAMPSASITAIDSTHALVHIVVPGDEHRLGDEDMAGIYGTLGRLLRRWSIEDLQGVPTSCWSFVTMLQYYGS